MHADEHTARLKRAVFEPLVAPLEGEMAIYRGGLDRLIRLSNLRTNEHGFSAEAVVIAPIHSIIRDSVTEPDRWRLTGTWAYMWSSGATGRHLTLPYGYELYVDQALVVRIAKLLTRTRIPNRTIRRLIKRYDGLVSGCRTTEDKWPLKAMLAGWR